MKKKIIILLSILAFLFLVACSNQTKNMQLSNKFTKGSPNKYYNKKNTRIDRIVITGNCPFSVAMANDDVYSKIVGTGPWTFTKNINNELGNYSLLKDIKPNIDGVDNSFMNKQYQVNSESLEKLKPDKIFYYGTVQDDHLERFHVPIINLDRKRNGVINPSLEQDYWETTYEKELSLPITHKFKTAWDKSAKIMEKVRKKSSIVGKRALYIYMINEKEITVSGNGSYGDAYLRMSGLKNVASELPFFANKAQKINVSIEQILKWNPEVIVVCFGSANQIKERRILNNTLSKTDAFKNNAIISTPVGIHNWGGAGGESSLLPLYITNKLDKNSVTNKELNEDIKEYYQYIYNYIISNQMISEVLKDR